MLTLPSIVERQQQPYVAIRARVKIPFTETIDRVMPEIGNWMASHKVRPSAPPFFKYNSINMPDLELELGFPTPAPVPGDARVLSGVLPAGLHATLTYWGHYDNLMDDTAVLIGWAKERNLGWDMRETPEGDHFAARFEVYPNNPMDEPDPEKWETRIFIKLAEA